MFSDQHILPTESMIAGTNRNLLFYLYSDKNKKQLDVTGMTGRFALTDFVNESDIPILTKNCSVTVVDGEDLAILKVELLRNDTLNLGGKYIYQITINDNGDIATLSGIMEISNNFDKLPI